MTDHPAHRGEHRHGRSRRALRRAAIAIVMAIVFAGAMSAFVYQYTQSGLTPDAGVAHIAGLSAPVKVLRDAAGIPHIYAQNDLDAMRAFGWVQAHDRLFQIELRRRMAEGRLAEIFGPDLIENDYVYRLFDPEKFAEAGLAKYPPAMRAQLDAFTAGINAYISANRDNPPMSFRLVGLKPEPFRAEDIEAGALTIGTLLAFNLSEESLYVNLAPRMPPEAIAALMPVYPTMPFQLPPPQISAAFGGAKMAFSLAPGLAAIGRRAMPASNNWVVDGTMTASGKPMLANDPHLPQTLPSIWYEAILSTPNGFISGATTAGSPAISIGTNGHVAWGVTSVMGDVMDLSLEHLSADRTSYEFQGKSYPLDRRETVIRVKAQPDVHRTILSTRHGPIVSDVLTLAGNPLSHATVRGDYALAMRFAGTTPGPVAASGFAAADARTGKELVEGYRTFMTTPLNLVYADENGNIGWHVVGAIPNRVGFDGKYPTPGFTGDYEWNGMIPFDNLPHVENPPQHFIVTANNHLADVPYNGSWIAPWRYDRISDLLRTGHKMSLDDFKRIQLDRVSLYALRLRDALVAAGDGGDPDLKWALGELRRWDGAMTSDSRAAAIVAAAEVALPRRVFQKSLGPDFDSLLALGDTGGYPPEEDIVVRANDPIWNAGNGVPTRVEAMRGSLKDALAMLASRMGDDRSKWRWGALTTITFTFPLGENGGVLGWYFNRGPYPAQGGRQTVNNSWFDLGAKDPFKVEQISSYRFMVDLAEPEHALAMNHTGESDHPASPHYDDMIGPWRRGEYHPLDPDLTEAQAHASAELDLMP